MSNNPYLPPARTGIVSDNQIENPTTIVASTDAMETLAFTGKLVRGVSVFCGLGSLGWLFSTLMGFYYLGDFRHWTWLHTIQAYRLLFFPTMALLGFFGWKYANAINQISTKQTSDLGILTNAQGYFWLTVVLHVFIIICGIALSLSASFAYSR